jgi:hypothetical protein
MAYPDTDIDGTPWDAEEKLSPLAKELTIRLAEGLDAPLTMISPTTFTNTSPITITGASLGNTITIDPYKIGDYHYNFYDEDEEYEEWASRPLPEPDEIHLDPYRPADNGPVDVLTPWEEIANGVVPMSPALHFVRHDPPEVPDHPHLQRGALVAAGGWCAPSETVYKLPSTPTDRVAALAEQHPLVTLRMAIANELAYQGIDDPEEATTMALVESVTATHNPTDSED